MSPFFTQSGSGRKRWSRRLLIAIAVALPMLGVTLWSIKTARDTASREATRQQFAAVAMSLLNYSDMRGHLPYSVRRESAEQSIQNGPATGKGRPLYSWRVALVAFLEAWRGSWDDAQPWDHPANKELIELSNFYVYDVSKWQVGSQPFPSTIIFAITGPGTAFGDGGERPSTLKDIPPSCILAVETRASAIPWPAPGDFDIRTMPETINAPEGKGISSRHAGGFHVVFADGQVWFLSDKVPFETLKKFFTVVDANKYDREKLLEPFILR